jgi:hypothetical protein
MFGLFLIYGNGYCQVPDATVIIHQNMLNAFLDAVGPVSGKGDFNLLGAKKDYTWTVSNARIELKRDGARFVADANIKAGPFSYNAPAAGGVEVKYDPESNRIKIKVVNAVFEIYTKIFGKKIHIANVDAAQFYRPEFEFAGPRPVQSSVEVKLPDGRVKTLYIEQVSQELRIQEQEIVVTSQLAFSDRPPHERHRYR